MAWLCEFANKPIGRLRPADVQRLRGELATFVGQGEDGPGVVVVGMLRVNASGGPPIGKLSATQLSALQTDVRRWLDAMAVLSTDGAGWTAAWSDDEGPIDADVVPGPLAGWFPVGPSVNVSLTPVQRRGRGRGPRTAFDAVVDVRGALCLICYEDGRQVGHRLRRCADPECGERFLRGRKGAYHAELCYQRHYQEYLRHGQPQNMTFDSWKAAGGPRKSEITKKERRT